MIMNRYAVVLMLLLSTMLNYANAYSLTSETDKPFTIQVTGQAAIATVPDAFNVTFVFEETGLSVSKLNQVMQLKHDKLVQSLLELKVEKRDIQSLNINLYPTYEHRNGTQTHTGFKLSREVRVTSGSIADYANIIDAALGHGVARMQGFRLFNRDSDAHYKAALEAALDNAQNTAAQIANKLNAKVGRALSVQTISSGHRPVAVMAQRVMESAAYDMPGEVDISANISVVFELKYPEKKSDE